MFETSNCHHPTSNTVRLQLTQRKNMLLTHLPIAINSFISWRAVASSAFILYFIFYVYMIFFTDMLVY